jgi:hypothetical protein
MPEPIILPATSMVASINRNEGLKEVLFSI